MISGILYLSVHMELISLQNEPDHHVTVVMFTFQKGTVTPVLYTVQVLMMQPQ